MPALLIRWINDPSIKNFDLSSLQVIQSGGQRLQPEVRRRTKELIPSVTVQENFGMAEGMLMFVRSRRSRRTCGWKRWAGPSVRTMKCGSSTTTIKKLRLATSVNFWPAGPTRCAVTSECRSTMRARLRRMAFTAPGDLMRRHPSGNYMVEGRKKDLINRGGEKISAEEIENLILAHPAVQNVACVPMPDPILGERMCACVILRQGKALTLDQLVDVSHERRNRQAQTARAAGNNGGFSALAVGQSIEEGSDGKNRAEAKGEGKDLKDSREGCRIAIPRRSLFAAD